MKRFPVLLVLVASATLALSSGAQANPSLGGNLDLSSPVMGLVYRIPTGQFFAAVPQDATFYYTVTGGTANAFMNIGWTYSLTRNGNGIDERDSGAGDIIQLDANGAYLQTTVELSGTANLTQAFGVYWTEADMDVQDNNNTGNNWALQARNWFDVSF